MKTAKFFKMFGFDSVATDHSKKFIDVFREFNQRDGLKNDLAIKTIAKYENFAKNFENYLRSINNNNLLVCDLKISTVENFNYWLLNNLTSCCKTHASKHIERIKKVMDYAVIMGYAEFNSVSSYKSKRDKVKDVIHLEDHEFNLWINAKWHNEVYQKTQDLYTFSCTTGISYIDLFTYKTINDPNTGLWIESVRGKTNRAFYVPLFHKEFELALKIHTKYNGQLPILNNRSYNQFIREMASVLGIEKYLTSHTGRKTFATLKDQKGWPIGSISTMLGNTEDICRNHYVKASRKKIEFEILKRA